MTEIHYSRGVSKFDAHPEQRTASDFDALMTAVLSDRAPEKGRQYVCAPVRANGEGKPHRKKDLVLPCAFLAFDFDGFTDKQAFTETVFKLQRWQGFVYTTASHTEDAPRARAVLAASREMTRDERLRVSKAVQDWLDGQVFNSTTEECGGAIAFDETVYRAEQPLFCPPVGGAAYHLQGGRPVNVDEALKIAPAAKDQPSAQARAEAIATDDPVLIRLQERGMVKRQMEPGKVAVVCPCADDHTSASNETATVYFLPYFGGVKYGKFHCQHAHCQDRDQAEFLRALDLEPKTVWADQRFPRTDNWPIPEPLPSGIPDVMSFEAILLPAVFRPWISDIAERMQCPPDFPAVAAMIALAGVVGRRVAIRPKARDSWLVIPNLWGAAVGRPGIMKTPALQEPMKPLQRLEIDAKQVFEEALRDYEIAKQVSKERKSVAGSAIRKAIKGGADPKSVAREYADTEQPEPTRQRFIVNDTTVEMLGVLLNENPNSLLLFRDELSGFLRGMERDGQESARAFYLEAWDGTGRFTYDRIGRGTLDIEHACVSVLGGIQPGPLADYLRRAPDDGLMQRFQLTVWPDVSIDWRNVDNWPDTTARNTAYQVFTRLVALDPRSIGAQQDDGEDIPYLRFAPDAQEMFTEWRTGLELRLRRNDLPAALESHLSKFRKLVPALALLIHLADNPQGGPLPLITIEQACAWAEYLESHAQRLYSPATNPAYSSAQALANRIDAGTLGERFTLRDVYKHHWSELSTPEQAREAVGVLVEFDWLRPEDETTGGRPRTWYSVNPRLKEIDR